ncbi:MAG: hypothetical protein M3Z17_08740 [Gemmatimonadota bacterium]|nr:hypothetical protein [Gemmatimonadota bacterium]
MRKISLFIGGAVVALAACSGDNQTAANDTLKKDLELASTSDGLGVGTAAAANGTQVVSAIERTAPAPKAPALSSKAHRYHKAPTQTPAPVVTEAPATVTTPEPTPVATEPVATEPAPQMPRPTPQTSSYPGGITGTVGRGPSTGPSTGSVLGSILGAVIRGAVVGGMGDGDTCDPRTEGRNRRGGGATISINQRIPRIGTFPR